MSKLVRDKIIERMIQDGREPVFHIADNAEYWERLTEKLVEEAEELMLSSGQEEIKEEITDVMEVLAAICIFLEIDLEELEVLVTKKGREKGHFHKRIIFDRYRDSVN